jgi:hypothetical protein
MRDHSVHPPVNPTVLYGVDYIYPGSNLSFYNAAEQNKGGCSISPRINLKIKMEIRQVSMNRGVKPVEEKPISMNKPLLLTCHSCLIKI